MSCMSILHVLLQHVLHVHIACFACPVSSVIHVFLVPSLSLDVSLLYLVCATAF